MHIILNTITSWNEKPHINLVNNTQLLGFLEPTHTQNVHDEK